MEDQEKWICRIPEQRAINGWADMARFGIRILTGEACAYSMRVLCDLTEEGLRHVQNFFGVFCPGENWNSGAIRSVLLPRSVLYELAAFCLLESGSEVAYIVTVLSDKGKRVIGGARKEIYANLGPESRLVVEQRFENSRHPQGPGGRNIHQMTQRYAGI